MKKKKDLTGLPSFPMTMTKMLRPDSACRCSVHKLCVYLGIYVQSNKKWNADINHKEGLTQKIQSSHEFSTRCCKRCRDDMTLCDINDIKWFTVRPLKIDSMFHPRNWLKSLRAIKKKKNNKLANKYIGVFQILKLMVRSLLWHSKVLNEGSQYCKQYIKHWKLLLPWPKVTNHH